MLAYKYLVLSAFLLDSHLTVSTSFLVHLSLWLPFFFSYSHTFAHIYSLTFPFLSPSHVVSIMSKNCSSFSICIFCNCHFSREEHTLYLKSLEMVHETHQINNRGFCFITTKPWSPSWKIVIVENIDSRCVCGVLIYTLLYSRWHIIFQSQ